MSTMLPKTDVIRRSNSDDIKAVWESIRNIRIQKQIAVLDKLIKNVSREVNINEEAAKRMILNVEFDGLIERSSTQSSPSFAHGPINNEFFTLPDFTKMCIKGSHDWSCFCCHLAGEVLSCSTCFRSYHINCFKELKQNAPKMFNRFPKNSDKLLCPSCEIRSESEECFSRKQVRKLLDFATHFIRKKSIWKDMATIGFRGEITKNEYLVHRYLDLDLIQRKIKDGRYTVLYDLVDDAEIFVHDVCILHGIFSDKADQARVLLREIKDEVREVQLCADCYINAKAKLAEWITKPCKPPHKLIWAKQAGNPGGQYFWPAKMLAERSDGFEVRFFGGLHDRAFVKKSDTKSFNFRPEEVEIKAGSGFDRAWNEVGKLREKVEQGYYTQSSGESDLPPTEDDYSDEIYLGERRSAGLSLSDNNPLANGGAVAPFSSLSSRRTLTLEKGRKPVVSPIPAMKRAASPDPALGKPPLKKRRSSRGAPGAKSVSSGHVRSERSAGGATRRSRRDSGRPVRSSDDGDNDSDISSSSSSSTSSSSVNMKSMNYQFSPKPTQIRSPLAAAKGLRQNRKPSTKMSQLSSSRYTSLSDRIKMDLSSTDSSDEFHPKQERIGVKRKRGRKPKHKPIPGSKPLRPQARSPSARRSEAISASVAPHIGPKPAATSSDSDSDTGAVEGADEDTDRCVSPPDRRLANQRLQQRAGTSGGRRGVAAADSTSSTAVAMGMEPLAVTTTSPRVAVAPGTSSTPVPVPPPKRMVHKCVNTTIPACNCQEKFDKKLEEETQRLAKEHAQKTIDLELKLKMEFDESTSMAIKLATEELRLQMQETLDKEKAVNLEAIAVAEARHNETLTNTKRRQWCRNCLKEAIYHCCWNTSYCSIQCQQEHWQKEHKRICRRKR